MLTRRTTLILATVAAATVLGTAGMRSTGSIFQRAELAAQDLVAQYGRHTAPNPKLIFLAIDAESVNLDAEADLKDLFGLTDESSTEYLALKQMSQHWPWPRSTHALIIERLLRANAKVVVFDLTFPTPSDDDEAFRRALDQYGDRVVLGSNFSESVDGQGDGTGATLTRPAASLIPHSVVPDSRVGFVNFWPDADGVIRRAQFQTNFAQLVGAPWDASEINYSSLAAQAVRKYGAGDRVPTDNESRIFRYTAGPQQGFHPRSIFEIFVPSYWKQNFHSGTDFDGAIVIVGAAGNWQHDDHPTPFGVMPGSEIQLNVMNAILHGEFITPLSRWVDLLVWLLAGTSAAGCALLGRSPGLRIAATAGVAGVWALAQLPLFNYAGRIAPVVGPLTILGVTALFTLVYDLIAAGAEQLRLRRNLLERKRAQEILEQAKEELERRVAERTAELRSTNEALTTSLNEKDVLLKEIHHRVKNNMQVISSLLNLQSGYITDPVALEIFAESRNRVRSMALVHEKLYQSGDLSCIDFQDYVGALTSGLRASFAGKASGVRITVDSESIMLGVDSAVPCGLIVNELVTNCFKYAFAPGSGGEIRIAMKRLEDARLELSVADDGVGFPKDVDFRNTESLGMQLVTTLTEQLDGNIALRNGCGTKFEISFPEANPTKL